MDMDGPLGAALASGMDTEYTLSAALSTHPDIYRRPAWAAGALDLRNCCHFCRHYRPLRLAQDRQRQCALSAAALPASTRCLRVVLAPPSRPSFGLGSVSV